MTSTVIPARHEIPSEYTWNAPSLFDSAQEWEAAFERVSSALAGRILSGEPGAAKDYLGFLKAGGSQYPLDALKAAGVDLATPQPVEETFRVLAGMVDKLEELVG